jgi:hypothetical protein
MSPRALIQVNAHPAISSRHLVFAGVSQDPMVVIGLLVPFTVNQTLFPALRAEHGFTKDKDSVSNRHWRIAKGTGQGDRLFRIGG